METSASEVSTGATAAAGTLVLTSFRQSSSARICAAKVSTRALLCACTVDARDEAGVTVARREVAPDLLTDEAVKGAGWLVGSTFRFQPAMAIEAMVWAAANGAVRM
jgi:hypothetical protein